MATHSSILAWRIPVDRGAWWATVHGKRTAESGFCVSVAPGRHIACETLGLRGTAQTRPAWERPEPTSQAQGG